MQYYLKLSVINIIDINYQSMEMSASPSTHCFIARVGV